MNRKEIKRLNCASPYCFETDREEDWYKIGCIDGLAAADAEPDTTKLWHDVTEEPRLNQWFIAQIGEGAFDTFIMAMDRNQDWKSWCKGLNIKRWAYVNDLLPKGGEK